MRRLISLSLLALTLAGCMVGPDYVRPTVETPPAWRLTGTEAQDTANTAWWQQLGDPVLNDLIASAIKENKDLMVATARVDQFAAQYGVVRADLYPQIGASAAFGQQQATKRGGNDLPSGYHTVTGGQQAVLNASWELDIWGRIRRSSEAARADLLASEEGRRGVILSLVSSVAVSYVNLRDLDKQLEISIRTTESRKGSYELLKLRFEAGIINEMQLSQSKSEYEQALATISQIEKAIALQENGLCVLLGRNPGPIPRGKSIDDLKLPTIPAGLPSDLLERRPDIKAAEQNLIAANAFIGVAKAAYFPAISLTGLFGYSSSEFSDLFTGPAKIWQYSAPITAPIFTAGKIASQVKATEALQQQALYRYQQTIQTAFREVNDSLADQSLTRQELEAQFRRVEALRTYASLAWLRFDEGYSSYLEVLDAERSLFNVELAYVQSQALLFQASINLYKAMGGGWMAEADKLATAAPAAPAAADYPCMDEIEKYCKDIPPGKGELILCLSKRRQDLGPVCREKVDKNSARLEEARRICTPDIEKYCPKIVEGQGRLLKCFKDHIASISPACREQVEIFGGKVNLPPKPAQQGGR
jgi:multidrug efflux system outer membrane protein